MNLLEKRTLVLVPTKKESAQGRHLQSRESGNGVAIMGQNRAQGVKIPLRFYREKSGNRLVTGLDKVYPNPYYEKEISAVDAAYRPKGVWIRDYEKLSQQKEITLQTFYECLDGVERGTYTDIVNSRTMANSMHVPKEQFKELFQRTELQDFFIKLDANLTAVFDNTTKRGRLGIAVIESLVKAERVIAESLEEVDINVHDWVITTIEEANKTKTSVLDASMKAMSDMHSVITEYDSFVKKQIAVLLEVSDGQDVLSTVDTNLKFYVFDQKKTRQGKYEERLIKFSKVHNLLTTDTTKLYLSYIIKAAFNKRVFVPDGTYIKWTRQKGSENLYDLGNDRRKILSNLTKSYNEYIQDADADNFYAKLIEELQVHNVEILD